MPSSNPRQHAPSPYKLKFLCLAIVAVFIMVSLLLVLLQHQSLSMEKQELTGLSHRVANLHLVQTQLLQECNLPASAAPSLSGNLAQSLRTSAQSLSQNERTERFARSSRRVDELVSIYFERRKSSADLRPSLVAMNIEAKKSSTEAEQILSEVSAESELIDSKLDRLSKASVWLAGGELICLLLAITTTINKVPNASSGGVSQNALNEAILDEMKVGIVVVDIAEEKIEFINRHMERMFKIDRQAVLGREFSNLFSAGKSMAMGLNAIESCTQGQKIRIRELIGRKNYDLELTAAVEEIGNQDKAIFCVRDITAELEAERLKQQFVALISHEIRTPVSSLLLFLDSLAESVGEANKRLADRAGAQAQNIQRLLRLVNDLLDIEKLESDSFQLDISSLSVDELIAESVESILPLANEKGIRIVSPPADPNATLVGDQQRLVQVLINLLSNAIKYSPPSGTVRIELDNKPDALHIRVADQGRGIPAELMEKIFDRYYQVEVSDSSRLGGAGLGLAICKSIVVSHKGTIEAEAVPTGASFLIRLPKRT